MTSAPATVAIGRARIEVHTDSVNRVCTSMAWSGSVLAQPAAWVAAPAVLSTARCAVPLKRSTWAVVLSATVSTTLCAVCATFSILGLVFGLGLVLEGVDESGVVRSILIPFHVIDFGSPLYAGQGQRQSAGGTRRP